MPRKQVTWRPYGHWATLSVAIIACLSVAGSSFARTGHEAAAPSPSAIQWQQGPCTAKLGEVAEIDVPSGFSFTGPAGARIWAHLTENQPSDTRLGVLVPNSLSWYVTFDFDAIGYVRDSERDDLNAEAILASIRANTARANVYRRQRGWSELHVVGWDSPPSYDAENQFLVWAIRGQSEGSQIVNYNSRILGRGGVMSVSLVDSPDSYRSVVPIVKGILTGFRYRDGQRYDQWEAGDDVAAIGLSGLIVGGGTAVAAKTGWLTKFGAFLAKSGKWIVLVVIAFLAWLSRQFGRRSSQQG